MGEYEFPLSPGQDRLLVLETMAPGSAQYHVPVAFTVHGPFEPPRFSLAFDAVVARHESLRTVLRAGDQGYHQVVSDESTAAVRVGTGLGPAEVDAAIRHEADRPFDLEHGPLLRCAVYEVTDGSHRILLTAHHTICDGWSVQIMLRELAAAYRDSALCAPAPLQYPDYAAWQASQPVPSPEFWTDLLHDAPQLYPLPTDRARPAMQTTAGAAERFDLPAGLPERVAALARDNATTPFVVMFAAYAVFLARIAGRTDLVVGVPVAGRDHPDVQQTVGLLTNTIALRADLSGNPGFTDLITRVRDLHRASAPHQNVPFSAVVDAVAGDRRLSHDPLVQVVFSYDDDTALDLDLTGCRTHRIDVPTGTAKFDLTLVIERFDGVLSGQFQYRSDLLDAATVRAWISVFRTLADDLVRHPARPVHAANLLAGAERDRLLQAAHGSAEPVPTRAVPDLIAQHAAAHPQAIAVEYDGLQLSYQELITRADALAAVLLDAGTGPETPVAVCMPRSADYAIAALAVWRAGGVLLPLDPGQPPARLTQMITDAQAVLVLATTQTAALTAGARVVVVDAALAAPPRPEPAGPAPIRPEHAAYLLFTSGTTGTPKATTVDHRALTNLATAVRTWFGVGPSDRLLQHAAFSFDAAVADLVFAWTGGATLHIAPDHERLGRPLHDLLAERRITWTLLTPAAAMSLPAAPDALPDLKTLVVGGEPCPAELVTRWAAPGRRIVNAYGPSETTYAATAATMHPGEPIRIGHPLPNTRVYVLDRALDPAPTGVVGEIYVAGAGVGRGYPQRPGLTAQRFLPDPYGPPGARMYRTGDLGRLGPDGAIAHAGRVDGQVKVRGFRIELDEIETVLAGHPAVAVAAVTVRHERLIGYVVAGHTAPEPAGLRAWLTGRLPGYMVPEHLGILDTLPLGTTGKVDRARLPDPPTTRPDTGRPYTPPRTDAERRVAQVWSSALELDEVGVHDNFFDLGGNSVRLLTVLAGLRAHGDTTISMVDLFALPTVADLAGHLDTAAPRDNSAARNHGQDRRRMIAARRRATRTTSTNEGNETR